MGRAAAVRHRYRTGCSPLPALFGGLAGLILGLLVLVPPAAAQPILVRSGEHEGFSRLAMVLAPPRPWSFALEGDAHVLRISGAAGFDLSQVFTLIPRDRLRDVAALPDGQGLRLELACDCPLRAFEDRPGVLVIDILDALPSAPEGDTGLRPAPRPRQASPADPGLALQPDETTVPEQAGGALGAWLGSGLGPVPALPPLPDQSDRLTDVAADTRIGEARQQLAVQIARAASQNLLSVAALPAGERRQARVAGTAPADSGGGAEPGLGLSVASAADRDLRDARSRRTGTGVACIAGDLLDIGTWGEPGAGWGTIMQRRGALLGEFDSPLPGAVQALARGYLHLGLGAEASAVLRAFPGQAEDEELLLLLARLAEGATEPDAALAGMAECGGPAALWALLARDDLPPREELDRAGLLLGFSALPPHLRRLLGPRLSERFLDAGEAAIAMTLRDAILRTPDGGGPATALLDARLALESGMAGVAAELLTPLANSGRAEAPEAGILLVEALLSDGRPVPDPLRDTLAALSFEHRGTGLGTRLEAALAVAEGSAGRFAAAFARKARVGAELPRRAADLLDRRLLALLVEQAPDDAFLRHALPATAGWSAGGAPPELRQPMARRFLGLGLPEAALAALGSGPRAPEPERRQRAEALLDLDDPSAALPQLAGLAGPEAAALRARALEALGDPVAAAASLAEAGLAVAASDLAWRSGTPALIARHGTAEQIAVAVAGAVAADGFQEPAGTGPPVLEDPTAATDGSGLAGPADEEAASLFRARELLAAGAGLRGDIEALLMAHPEP